MSDPLKGKLDVGDRVHLAVQVSAADRALLADLENSSILSVNGNKVLLLPEDGSMEVEIDRRYFCSGAVGHFRSPCSFCGYEIPRQDIPT